MKNKVQYLVLFLFGALCFFLSQIVLRLPLLNYLQGRVGFSMFSLRHPSLVLALVLLSASLFEEGFRFLFRKFLLRAEGGDERGLYDFADKIGAPIAFGLGHGLCEVFYVFNLVSLSLGLTNYTYVVVERILAVIFHICQAILIFKGFKVNRKYSYLLLAIVLHTAFNGLIYASQYLGVWGLYGVFGVFDLVYVLVLKKKTYEKKGDLT